MLTTTEQPPFPAALQPNQVWSYEDVRPKLGQDDFLLMDARSEGRFKGTEPEPREGKMSYNSGAPKTRINHCVFPSKAKE